MSIPPVREISRSDAIHPINCSQKFENACAFFNSKWSTPLYIIVGLAGGIIVSLSALKFFGGVGSIGFATSMVAGSASVCIPIGKMIHTVVIKCKELRENNESNPEDGNLNAPSQIGDLSSQLNSEIIYTLSAKENALIQRIAKEVKEGKDISNLLQQIPKDFFSEKSQERAKSCFSKVMMDVLGAHVDFPKTGPLEEVENLSGELDPEVFQTSNSLGVQKDILSSAQDEYHVHVYQTASQYSASETKGPFTPEIGSAMKTSENDKTQGPLTQRTNPQAFELATAFLTHLGYNMLDAVLPSAGKTYEKKAPIEHGYLRPNNTTIETLTEEFKKNFSHSEYVCYSSDLENSKAPVYIFLQAAPAIGYARITVPSDELQKYAALANYAALFRHGIHLAKQKNAPVVLHANAVGGGVFGNHVDNLLWGFEKAALAFQSQMKEAQVFVQLEAFKGKGAMITISEKLNISSKDRIGDLVQVDFNA